MLPSAGYVLAPCPFCGAIMLNLIAPDGGGVRVVCPTCNMFGPRGETWEEALDLWNTRRPPAYGTASARPSAAGPPPLPEQA